VTRVRDARGAATAELAMVLPLLVGVTLGLVWLLAVGAGQVRAVDAARETARALARGEDQSAAIDRGLAVAPDGSSVTVSRGGGEVHVTVTGRVSGPGGIFSHLPSPRLRAEAVAADEEVPAP
jgi:Flp pilus assembly protein TadG